MITRNRNLNSGQWRAEQKIIDKIQSFIKEITKYPCDIKINKNLNKLIIRAGLSKDDITLSDGYSRLKGIATIEVQNDNSVFFEALRPVAWPWWYCIWWTMPLEVWGLTLISYAISIIYFWNLYESSIVEFIDSKNITMGFFTNNATL